MGVTHFKYSTDTSAPCFTNRRFRGQLDDFEPIRDLLTGNPNLMSLGSPVQTKPSRMNIPLNRALLLDKTTEKVVWVKYF